MHFAKTSRGILLTSGYSPRTRHWEIAERHPLPGGGCPWLGTMDLDSAKRHNDTAYL
jgi:hypothetical protein